MTALVSSAPPGGGTSPDDWWTRVVVPPSDSGPSASGGAVWLRPGPGPGTVDQIFTPAELRGLWELVSPVDLEKVPDRVP